MKVTDWIRAMNDEELTAFMYRFGWNPCDWCRVWHGGTAQDGIPCRVNAVECRRKMEEAMMADIIESEDEGNDG